MLGSIGTAIYRGAMAGATLDGIPRRGPPRAAGDPGRAPAAAAEHLPAQAGAQLLGAARDAFTQSLQLTATICAVVAAATAVAAVILLRRQPRDAAPAHAPELPLGPIALGAVGGE